MCRSQQMKQSIAYFSVIKRDQIRLLGSLNISPMEGMPLNDSLITGKRLCVDFTEKPMIRNSKLLRTKACGLVAASNKVFLVQQQ